LSLAGFVVERGAGRDLVVGRKVQQDAVEMTAHRLLSCTRVFIAKSSQDGAVFLDGLG
jgi:hypothetical protein